MRVAYLSLIFFTALFVLLRLSIAKWNFDSDLPSSIQAPIPASFAEQQFALGRKVKFSSVDLYDLELIPGISDKLGNSILEARPKVLAWSPSTKAEKKLNPFELIKGVGKGTAAKLEKYLILE